MKTILCCDCHFCKEMKYRDPICTRPRGKTDSFTKTCFYERNNDISEKACGIQAQYYKPKEGSKQ